MIYPIERKNNHKPCISQKQGTCCGCEAAKAAYKTVRWNGVPLAVAQLHLTETYCPDSEVADLTWCINQWASFTMGTDHRAENLEGLSNIRPDRG